MAIVASNELVLTITEPALIRGAACFMHRNGPETFTPSTSATISSDHAAIGPTVPSTPALLKRKSRLPKRFTVASINAATAGSSVTLTG
jgi:hypothetical protein